MSSLPNDGDVLVKTAKATGVNPGDQARLYPQGKHHSEPVHSERNSDRAGEVVPTRNKE